MLVSTAGFASMCEGGVGSVCPQLRVDGDCGLLPLFEPVEFRFGARVVPCHYFHWREQLQGGRLFVVVCARSLHR